jgi:hypothetical protein
MTMRTIYYVLLFVSLLLLLFCANALRWLISKFRLALLSVSRGLSHRDPEWRGEAVLKESLPRRS